MPYHIVLYSHKLIRAGDSERCNMYAIQLPADCPFIPFKVLHFPFIKINQEWIDIAMRA